MDTTNFFNLSDLTITGVTPNGQPIVLNISSNTTNESIDLSITANNNLDYSFSDDGSLHLSDLNISSSSLSNNTTQESYPFHSDESLIDSANSSFSFGGKITRNHLNFFQKNESINSTMKGLTIIDFNQLVDHHTLVHHANPNCESHQDYKGIYSGKSTGVFNGKIIVDKIAQKTNAFQQNNNILIDDKSTINSKPQLEIFADDVKCSHGCTIGQLDQDALFYLRARGIPKKEAKALLTYAFANNVLESVQISELKTKIKKIIANKLGVNIGFDL